MPYTDDLHTYAAGMAALQHALLPDGKRRHVGSALQRVVSHAILRGDGELVRSSSGATSERCDVLCVRDYNPSLKYQVDVSQATTTTAWNWQASLAVFERGQCRDGQGGAILPNVCNNVGQ